MSACYKLFPVEFQEEVEEDGHDEDAGSLEDGGGLAVFNQGAADDDDELEHLEEGQVALRKMRYS